MFAILFAINRTELHLSRKVSFIPKNAIFISVSWQVLKKYCILSTGTIQVALMDVAYQFRGHAIY